MNRLLRHSCRKQRKRLRAAAEFMAISGRDPREGCVYVCVFGRGREVGPACQVGVMRSTCLMASLECQVQAGRRGWRAGTGGSVL